MATTITSSFSKLKSNLEITGLQSETVATRQKNVRKVVENGMTVDDSFLTGSYMRSTMIAPLKDADVDIFTVLDKKYFYDLATPAALLDKLRNVLLKTYTTSPRVSRNGQAVTIQFTDFYVDVVPAFSRKGGGYLIPNSYDNNWIATDPSTHVSYFSKQNSAHNGMLVPVIKMIKGWNVKNGSPFLSFYLELLADKIFTNVKISDFPSGMRYFFDKGREQCKWAVSDPSPYGNTISREAFLSEKDAVSRFDTAYSRALKAEEYEAKGKTEDAVNEWRKIFGDYFPAYG